MSQHLTFVEDQDIPAPARVLPWSPLPVVFWWALRLPRCYYWVVPTAWFRTATSGEFAAEQLRITFPSNCMSRPYLCWQLTINYSCSATSHWLLWRRCRCAL